MARLNVTEKLILSGANNENAMLNLAYRKAYEFFEDASYLVNDNFCTVLDVLYKQKHETLTFENIARNNGLSLSKLNRFRQSFIKLFIRYKARLSEQQNAA